ncbi:hypothetical protein Ddc_19665 [Ditylenchus destructor]|nr:hypothetical protein Ddc_19665 [Ditylenchus destructor]
MQRGMSCCRTLKKILASHKKTRYYASHRMLKRSRRGTQAKPVPRQRSERNLKAAPDMPRAQGEAVVRRWPARGEIARNDPGVFPWIFRVRRSGKLYN